MTKREKVFNLFVTIAVVATGTVFGAWAGMGYFNFWWVGLIVGGITAYPLAKMYLKQLDKIHSKNDNRIKTWLWGSFIGILSGIVCTTIVHVIMTFIAHTPDEPIASQMDGFWGLVIIGAEIFGAFVGFVLGAICSLVYVLAIKGEHRETA